MKQPKDKRTKAYKEWKAKQVKPFIKPGKEWVKVKKPIKGLGDLVEKITEITGIKKAIEFFTDGKDCGCDKRKAWLNEEYNWKHPKCMLEMDYIWWTDFLIIYNKRLEHIKKEEPHIFDLVKSGEVQRICTIYRRLFNIIKSVCRDCPSGIPTIKGMIADINKTYDSYE